jgi:alanine dehydrogenase
MNIGIPKETSSEERRVALTPVGVYALTKEGHIVYVEKGAGKLSGFSDQEYRDVGAQVVFSREEVFHRSQLIAKIQPPTEEECQFLSPGEVVFSFLNLGIPRKNTIKLLLEKGATALGYELIEQPNETLPVLTAMSEIAGLLLPQIAGRLLEGEYGGRGIMLSGISGIPPANVVVLGAGVVGLNAARAFSGLGAQVFVMDKDINKLRQADKLLNKQIATSIVTPLLVEKAVRFADVLVGAVFIYGKKTPHLVSEDMVREMKKGSVIIDVSIDQGGCIETSRPTTLSSPTFVQHGVIHYCVPNIPASVARTASHALNNAVLPWVLQVARLGIDAALKKYDCLQKGIYFYEGQSTLNTVAELFDLQYQDINAVLGMR